jgi:hypothetical protein
MRNERAERRKRKLTERRRSARIQDAKRRVTTQEARRGNMFPGFAFSTEYTKNADPQFVQVIKKAVQCFDFAELPEYQQIFFQRVRKYGAESAWQTFEQEQRQAINDHPGRGFARFADIQLHCTLGHHIFAQIPEADRRRFWVPFNGVELPVVDVEFLPCQKVILVRFLSLLTKKTATGTTYYSRHMPTVKFGERQYHIGFSKHALEQTCKRIKTHWKNYAELGDLFAYFDQCVYFEPCFLRDGTPAVSFFDDAGDDERYWQFSSYVNQVLGMNGYSAARGRVYYRVGYCPVAFEGEFAKATSLLFPGFVKTPEYAALDRSRLSPPEKQRISNLARNSDMDYLINTGDFTAIKWFHDNGVRQVIQTTEQLFKR